MTASTHDEPAELPADVAEALAQRGIAETSEVALRLALEAHVPGYSLYRLMPAARKRWKCRYRIMLDASYYDSNSPAEVYARALLAALQARRGFGAVEQVERGAGLSREPPNIVL